MRLSSFAGSGLLAIALFGCRHDGETGDPVDGNDAPVVSSLTVSPQQLVRGGSGQAVASAVDADGDALAYSWVATGGFTVEAGTDAGTAVVTAPDESDAQGSIEVTVDDGNGGVTTASVSVSTTNNRAPTLGSLVAVPPAVDPSGTIHLAAVATDADGDALEYQWEAPEGWVITATGSTADVVAPDAYSDVGLVKLTVTDSAGDTVDGQLVVSTVANLGPRLTSVVAQPSLVGRGDTSQLTAFASHANGESLTYLWTPAPGWTLIEDSAAPDAPRIQAPSEPGVNGMVELTVTDPRGASVTGSVALATFPNREPVITSIFATPPVTTPGGSVHLEATVHDPDGDPLTYIWTAPNGWTGTSDTGSLDLTAPDLFGASGVVKLEVDDGYGTTLGMATVSTAANQAPLISYLAVEPQVIGRGGTAALRATAFDPNGDPVALSWSVDDTTWQVQGTTLTTLVAPDAPDSLVTVTVKATDANGAETTAQIAASTVPNQVPEIFDVFLTPSGLVGPGATVALSADAADADGDPLSYEWTPPSGWQVTGTGASVSLIAPNSSAVSGIVNVRVTDAYGGAATSVLTVATRDTVPAPFSFTDVPSASPGSVVTSNGVVVTGFDGPITAVCTGCTVARNGGAYSASTAGFMPGDTINLRVTASSTSAGRVTASVALGGTTSGTWSVTTATVGQIVPGTQNYGVIVPTNGTYGIQQLKYNSATLVGNVYTIYWPVVFINGASWTGGGTPTDGYWHGLHSGCGNVNGVATCKSVCSALTLTYVAVNTNCSTNYPTTNMNANGRNLYMSNNAGVPTGVWNTYTPDPALGNGNNMEWCSCSQ